MDLCFNKTLAPGNSFAPAKKKDAFAKNCLAKHAKAQSIVQLKFYTFLDAFQIENDAIRI